MVQKNHLIGSSRTGTFYIANDLLAILCLLRVIVALE
jgi:hypothetical protein